jgi:hypothetical protein
VGSAHKNSNLFDLFKGIPKRSDLISIKRCTFRTQNFQIKFGCEGIQIRNNFPYLNVSRFGIEFELKFREGCRCLNSMKFDEFDRNSSTLDLFNLDLLIGLEGQSTHEMEPGIYI